MSGFDAAIADFSNALSASPGTGAAVPADPSQVPTPPSQFDGALADLTKSPEQVKAALGAPTKPGGGASNFAAGANSGIASILGAPADITNAIAAPAGMAARWLGNTVRSAVGAPQITTPIPNAIPGGSADIESGMGALGFDPRNVGANDWEDRLARAAGGAIPSALGVTGAARALAAGMAPGVTQGVLKAVGSVSPGAAAGVGASGALGGAAAEEGVPDKYKPLANLAGNVAGGAVAAAAGSTATQAADLAGDWLGSLVRPFVPSMAPQAAAEKLLAAASNKGNLIGSVGSDVPLFTNQENLVPGSTPTTFQLTGDTGLGQAERQARTANPQPFLDQAADQNAARVTALQDLAPDAANPASVRDLFQKQLAAVDQDGDHNIDLAKQNAADAMTLTGGTLNRDDYGAMMRDQLEAAKGMTKAAESKLWQAIDPDGSLTVNAVPVKQQAMDIISSIPDTARKPEGEEAAIYSAAQMLGTASPFSNFSALRGRLLSAIRAEKGSPTGDPQAIRRMQILRQSIDDTMSNTADTVAQQQAQAVAAGTMSPEQTALNRILAWQSDWNATNGRLASGSDYSPTGAGAAGAGFSPISAQNGTVAPGGTGVPAGVSGIPSRNLALQRAGSTGSGVDSGQIVGGSSVGNAGAGAAAVPGLSGAEGSSARGAGNIAGNPGLQNPAPVAPTFDDAAAARYRAANDATRQRAQTFNTGATGQILQAGPNGTPYRITDTQVPPKVYGTPEGVQSFLSAGGSPDTLKNALVQDLRSTATNPDGTLNTTKYQGWINRRADVLRGFPDLQQTLGNAATAQNAVDDVAASAADATKTYQQSAARYFLNAEPQQAVAAAFASKNPSNDFAQLSRLTSGNPDAKAGLQRAIVDHMMNAAQSNRPGGATGIAELNPNALQNYVTKNRAALGWVFTPEQLDSMQSVAADIQRSNLSVSGSKIPGQSNTAQDLAPAKKSSVLGMLLQHGPAAIGVMVGHHIGEEAGSLLGGAMGEGFSAARRAGLANIDGLVEDALLNPSRARALMMAYTPRSAPMIGAQLRAQYGALAAMNAAQQAQRLAPAMP